MPRVPGKDEEHPTVGEAAAPCPTLCVAITAMNSMRTMAATLRSVVGLASKVVVIDSGSTDGTIEFCRSLGAIVEYHPWGGNILQKRHAIERCRALHEPTRWILVLDSDEAVDAELASAIRGAVADPNNPIVGYELNRHLVFDGVILHHTFQPEWRLRLFRAGMATVTGEQPHDTITVNGPVGRLPGAFLHDSWADGDDMLRRLVGYAKVNAAYGAKGGSLVDILVRPGAAFIKQFILRQGFRDGWRGLVTAGGAAASALMKHIAIAERDGLKREQAPSGPSSRKTP